MPPTIPTVDAALAALIAAIPYPAIDPVALQIGPFAIRWYALAYIAGILLGLRHSGVMARHGMGHVTREEIDDSLLWMTLGIVIGGRLGHVLFYDPAYYLANPDEIAAVWRGGMSFHGGVIGVVVAMALYAWRRKLRFLMFADLIVCGVPIGLFFGRIANFINGEVFGRVSDVPWAMVFPQGGPLPRHPSQLYEAALEGLVLLLMLSVLARRGALQRPGFLSGVFLLGYGVLRSAVEFVREPDGVFAFQGFAVTFGQAYSVPLILAGLALMLAARRRGTA